MNYQLNKSVMDVTTENLLTRLNLKDSNRQGQLVGVIGAIKKLPLWKFPTGVHTIYVGAIKTISNNDPNWIRIAKDCCNERAITPVY